MPVQYFQVSPRWSKYPYVIYFLWSYQRVWTNYNVTCVQLLEPYSLIETEWITIASLICNERAQKSMNLNACVFSCYYISSFKTSQNISMIHLFSVLARWRRLWWIVQYMYNILLNAFTHSRPCQILIGGASWTVKCDGLRISCPSATMHCQLMALCTTLLSIGKHQWALVCDPGRHFPTAFSPVYCH